MDFSGYFSKYSTLTDLKLAVLLFSALYGDSIGRWNAYYKALLKTLGMREEAFEKIVKDLANSKLMYWSFYSFSPMDDQVLPIIVYACQKKPALMKTLKPLFKDNPKAISLYNVVNYAFCGGPKPKDEEELRPYMAGELAENLSWDDPQALRFLSYLPHAQLYACMLAYVDKANICNRRIENSQFELWRAEFSERHPNMAADILDLQAYQSYVQDGIYDVDFGKIKNVSAARLMTAAIRACNVGDYERCIELNKMAASYFGEDEKKRGVPTMFFSEYFAAAACLHLSTTKSKALAKRLYSQEFRDQDFTLATILSEAALDPNRQVDALRVRQCFSAMLGGERSGNLIYLAQMIGRHFEVPALSYVTGESAYAIVRHEVTPAAEQAQELLEAYGGLPAVLTVPYKQKWERLIENISEKLMKQEAPSAVRQTRRIFVFNEGSGELYPMEQSWLKSQRWGTPRSMARSTYSLSKLKDADKYDEAFAAICTSAYYWPRASVALPALKGCDRLYVESRRGRGMEPMNLEEETPYISVDKKTAGFEITSNLRASDLDEPAVLTKRKDGSYALISISEKARAVLQPLLSEAKSFPLEAEEKLRSLMALVDEVVEVRSKLLDRKSLPEYHGRPMIAVKLQPGANGTYDAAFCAQPLPDSLKTPAPGEGRKELIDNVGGQQVRVVRDIDGEKASYEAICEAMENISGIDLYEDEYRATLEIPALLELMGWAQAHSDNVAIDWMQGKGLQVKQSAGASWNVGLKANNGWFDIEGDVRIDDKTVLTMAQLLELVQRDKGRYLRLNDELFIEIDKKLRRQLEKIEAMAVRNHNKLQISQINAAMLDDAALDGEFKVKFDQKLTELQKNIKDSQNCNPPVPKTLNAELRPYQVEGFQWMSRLASWGAGACLADDMGLGKTVQTIAFLLSKAEEGPALVVAPASVVPNWEAELARFAPTLRPTVLNKAEDRAATIKGAKGYDVVLSTYGLLNTEEDALVEKKWSTICLDEAHTIKNRETKMSHVAMQLQADYRIILTGTPIQNHLGEIWNLFRFINPGLLGGFDTFKHKFVKPITEDNDKGRRKALQGILKPFMLRRTKAEVVDDLPEKNEIIVPVELSTAEMTRYEAMRKKAAQEIETADKVDINTLAEITRLRRAACSMKLVDASYAGEDSKVQAFLDIVSEFKGNGRNRMLVFSQFTSYLDIVRKALDKAGEKYLYLDGSTTMKQREQLVTQFRNGDVPLFLISLKAGGLGLNLPEANYVMHLDPWWNPAIEQQATDRAYRIGQTRDVTVYHLVAKNTIEEKILRLHRTKRDLADSLLEGTDMAGKLTVKDILELISQA
ncbi:MAG: DEAD/DEAH box helicase [Clostridium sp.]|nr:DEAD/DEAH box helicase [Clostridium sp.]